VVFRRDGDRYIAFLDDDRLGFVRRADNGTWNFVDTTDGAFPLHQDPTTGRSAIAPSLRADGLAR
jgi:hypothetical protein